MKTNKRWQQHLSDQVSARLDPLVYALQWARDPRCLRAGAAHRRVGFVSHLSMPLCSLWASTSKRMWG